MLTGEGGNDKISGGSGTDSLRGSEGNDILRGDEGNDVLLGGEGNDLLIGGQQADILMGQAGRDRYRLTVGQSQIDMLKDFSMREDIIQVQLASPVAGLKQHSSLKSAQFRLGSRAVDKNDRIIYQRSIGALFFDADGVGGTDQVQIAKMTAGTMLSSQQIMLL